MDINFCLACILNSIHPAFEIHSKVYSVNVWGVQAAAIIVFQRKGKCLLQRGLCCVSDYQSLLMISSCVASSLLHSNIITLLII